MVKGWVEKVAMIVVPLDPLVYVLGNRIPKLRNPIQKMVNCILTAARGLIAKKWKALIPPSEKELLERIRYVRRMDYLTALKHDKVDQFNKIWGSWDVIEAMLHT
ncbi:hypothetical protein XELAEV_18013168mg [Xenopus laevis]|uniref:Uncharacterized protein n=1 Tax=Xenopus laevis TaxID=8355 RepID=A0A974DP05_XENLA|nr:hypothetical protein XELAEV_18013168mg [Xenopus laevis]